MLEDQEVMEVVDSSKWPLMHQVEAMGEEDTCNRVVLEMLVVDTATKAVACEVVVVMAEVLLGVLLILLPLNSSSRTEEEAVVEVKLIDAKGSKLLQLTHYLLPFITTGRGGY